MAKKIKLDKKTQDAMNKFNAKMKVQKDLKKGKNKTPDNTPGGDTTVRGGLGDNPGARQKRVKLKRPTSVNVEREIKEKEEWSKLIK